MKKVLDVKTPLISCYTSYGALFSMLPDDQFTWIYSNFMQLVYNKGWEMFSFEGHRYLLSDCPCINYSVFSNNLISMLFHVSFFDIIKKIIDANEYIYIYIDRFYLSVDKFHYQNIHMPHEIFIYGYDSEKSLIYIADNLENGKFIFTTCPVKDIEEGFLNISCVYDFTKYIRTLSLSSNSGYFIDIPKIKHDLNAFIFSNENYYMNKEQDMIFGIAIFDEMEKQCHDFFLQKEKFDVRGFHLLYEYLLIMEQRIIYLGENHFLNNFNEYLEKVTNLKKDSVILRNFAFKYNVLLNNSSTDSYNLNQLLSGLKELKENEKNIFSDMIKDIV